MKEEIKVERRVKSIQRGLIAVVAISLKSLAHCQCYISNNSLY